MRLPLLALGVLAACSSPPMVVPDVKDPVVSTIDGAITGGASVTRTPVSMGGTPVQLASLGGDLAVVTADTVLTPSDTGMLQALPVGAPGEPMQTGAVRFAWRRGADSLWVVAANGLFHAAGGRLLRSPLSDDLGGLTVQAIDGYGDGVAEQLWLTTSTGVRLVTGGQMQQVDLSFPKRGDLGPPALAIAAGPGQAVIVAGQQVFFADVGANTAAWIAKDVGPLKAWTRSDDGVVLLATATGLYEIDKSLAVKRRTFAAAGGAVVPADDVASALGTVLVAAGGKLARLEGSGFTSFGTAAAPVARGLEVDASGDTWALDAASLVRFSTGKPVSYAADVKPFFDAHCQVCHQTGANNSPTINYDDYATAKNFAPLAVKRLKAEGVAPMPPVDTEVLTAASYAVVLEWVAGGMQP